MAEAKQPVTFPDQFLPIADDPIAIMVLADWYEEQGDPIAATLRRLAAHMERKYHIPLAKCVEGMPVWFFYQSGWERSAIVEVNNGVLTLAGGFLTRAWFTCTYGRGGYSKPSMWTNRIRTRESQELARALTRVPSHTKKERSHA